MLLYLTTNNKTNLLDFLSNDNFVDIKKIVGVFNLQNFMITDMRSFSHFTEVVLERTAFADTDSEFVNAIEEFMTMYSARITVIYEDLKTDSDTFKRLLDIGVGNIVTAFDIYDTRAEIEESLSEKGMLKYQVKERKNSDESYNFTCENVRIGIVGSQERIGTTTMAISMSHWLRHVSATVSYTQMTKQKNRFEYLARELDAEINCSYFSSNGIDFYTNEPQKNYNFRVYDLGINADGNLCKSMDILIVLCGTKMYELPYTAKILNILDRTYAYVIPMFLSEEKREDFRHLFDTEYFTPIYINYQPDLSDRVKNKHNYKNIIKDYIATT